MPFSRSRSIESSTRVAHVLAYAEGARLPQHRVHERRLAVVDVRDDRHVADVLSALQHCLARLAAHAGGS